jgi:hypothetical protein
MVRLEKEMLEIVVFEENEIPNEYMPEEEEMVRLEKEMLEIVVFEENEIAFESSLKLVDERFIEEKEMLEIDELEENIMPYEAPEATFPPAPAVVGRE